MKETETTKYERAKQKVDSIKSFYTHLRAYIIINIVLLLLRVKIYRFFEDGDFSNVHFERWLDLNIYGITVIWGAGLLVHGLYVFQYKFKFLKKWEERKIKEILDKDELD